MNEKTLQICSYEQAVALKRAGFDWRTYDWYDNDILKDDEFPCCFGEMIYAPTVALARKWMRDVAGVGGCITRFNGYEDKYSAAVYTNLNNGRHIKSSEGYSYFNTFESAESALLDALLNLIEQSK